MTPETVKTYPARGPLQQVRLSAAEELSCFRCGQLKRSKLHALYDGDWNRRLCNGCYGYLLSIYEVKAGTAPDDERAEELANALLRLVEVDVALEAFTSVAPPSSTSCAQTHSGSLPQLNMSPNG